MGRPAGSKNKPKMASGLELETNSLSCTANPPKKPKWAQPEPKVEKEREVKSKVVGQIEVKQAAIEWEPVEETAEAKRKYKEEREKDTDWKTFCSCTHSKTLHKTIGTGKCMLLGCKCVKFE